MTERKNLTGIEILVQQNRLVRISSNEIPRRAYNNDGTTTYLPNPVRDPGLSFWDFGILKRADEKTVLSTLSVSHQEPIRYVSHEKGYIHKKVIFIFDPMVEYTFHHSFNCRRFVLGKDLRGNEVDIAPAIHIDPLITRDIIQIQPFSQSQKKAYLGMIEKIFGEVPKQKAERKMESGKGIEQTPLFRAVESFVDSGELPMYRPR